MWRKVIVSVCASLLAVAAVAGESKGVAKSKMIEALSASANGECADHIMSPLLLDACEQQISQNRRLLAPLGEIKSVKYRGLQEFPNGDAEAYKVRFENGTMMWYASLDRAGKLLILWSDGTVRRE